MDSRLFQLPSGEYILDNTAGCCRKPERTLLAPHVVCWPCTDEMAGGTVAITALQCPILTSRDCVIMK
jgi:hypothetical protein